MKRYPTQAAQARSLISGYSTQPSRYVTIADAGHNQALVQEDIWVEDGFNTARTYGVTWSWTREHPLSSLTCHYAKLPGGHVMKRGVCSQIGRASCRDSVSMSV